MDHHLSTTSNSFSQLLFSNYIDDDNDDDDGGSGDNRVLGGLDNIDQTFHYSSSFFDKPQKMLCFGGYNIENEDDHLVSFDSSATTNCNVNEVFRVVSTPQRSGVNTCSDSSSASSATTRNNHISIANAASPSNLRKRNGSTQEPVQRPSSSVKATPANQRTRNKKVKMDNPTSSGTTRGRREKLGERIVTLQQLVSPFGKTDTASVLHEAMGYIRFLHDQVQVLCSPYLEHVWEIEENGEGKRMRRDLSCSGLCLVPVECTVHVAGSNGADYWSPAAMVNDFSLPSTKL